MRDIPVFTTENGAAGLVLREIPYKGIAYITLHDTLTPQALLQECVDFCTMAGAEYVYATGHPYLKQYPLHCQILQMQRPRAGLAPADAELYPVTAETAERWRTLYNDRMQNIPNGATMTRGDMEKLLARQAGYFIYREAELLGIGIAAGDTVESVIGAKPGAGETVLLALCSVLQSEKVVLEVASTNLPALRLYTRLGFEHRKIRSDWYCVKNKC